MPVGSAKAAYDEGTTELHKQYDEVKSKLADEKVCSGDRK